MLITVHLCQVMIKVTRFLQVTQYKYKCLFILSKKGGKQIKAAAEAYNPPRKIVLTEESSNNAASPLVLG